MYFIVNFEVCFFDSILLEDHRNANISVAPDMIIYSSLIKGYGTEGRIEEAINYLESLDIVANLKPDAVSINTLLDVIMKSKKLSLPAKQSYFHRLYQSFYKYNVSPTNVTVSLLLFIFNMYLIAYNIHSFYVDGLQKLRLCLRLLC